jgi:hypothetical protein
MRTNEKELLSHLVARRPEWRKEALHDSSILAKLAKKATKAAEDYCNGDIESAKFDDLANALKSQAERVLQPWGLAAIVDSDPRGFCLRIKGLPGNTWGGDAEGFGVE